MSSVLVSACLAGVACRYDGGSTPCPEVLRLVASGEALPLCPEELGGLPTPRNPVEIRNGRAIDSAGIDRTEAFAHGAAEAVRLAREAGCTRAILKARSPSCGCGIIYDGTFSHVRIPGDGFLSHAAKQAGFEVCTEEDL